MAEIWLLLVNVHSCHQPRWLEPGESLQPESFICGKDMLLPRSMATFKHGVRTRSHLHATYILDAGMGRRLWQP